MRTRQRKRGKAVWVVGKGVCTESSGADFAW